MGAHAPGPTGLPVRVADRRLQPDALHLAGTAHRGGAHRMDARRRRRRRRPASWDGRRASSRDRGRRPRSRGSTPRRSPRSRAGAPGRPTSPRRRASTPTAARCRRCCAATPRGPDPTRRGRGPRTHAPAIPGGPAPDAVPGREVRQRCRVEVAHRGGLTALVVEGNGDDLVGFQPEGEGLPMLRRRGRDPDCRAAPGGRRPG